jgi:hypothetical protein
MLKDLVACAVVLVVTAYGVWCYAQMDSRRNQ